MVSPVTPSPKPGDQQAADKKQAAAALPQPVAQKADKSLHTRSIESLDLAKFRQQASISVLGWDIPLKIFGLTPTLKDEKAFAKADTKTKIARLSEFLQKHNPSIAHAYKMERARQYLLQNDVDHALEDLFLVGTDKTSFEHQYLLAEAHWMNHNWIGAFRFYEKALQIFRETGHPLPEDAISFEQNFARLREALNPYHQLTKEFYKLPENVQNLFLMKYLFHASPDADPAAAKLFNDNLRNHIQTFIDKYKDRPEAFHAMGKILELATPGVEILDAKIISAFDDHIAFMASNRELFSDIALKTVYSSTFLLKLLALREKITPEAFYYLLDQYGIEDKNGDGVYTTILTADFIQGVLDSPERIQKFSKLLELEMKRDVRLLPLFIKHPQRLLDPVLDHLEKSETFSRCIPVENESVEANYKFLSTLLEKHPADEVYQLYELAGDYPYALLAFKLNISRLDPKLPPTKTTNLYKTLLDMRQKQVDEYLIDAWLKLFDLKKQSLALQLLDYPPDMRHRLLDMIAVGGADVVETLLARVQKHQKDPLLDQLLSIANGSNVSLINALLKLHNPLSTLHQQHFLVILACLNPPPLKLLEPLLTLHAQGDQELLNIATGILEQGLKVEDDEGELFLKWVSSKHFALAKEYWKHRHSSFWKEVTDANLEGVQADQLRKVFSIINEGGMNRETADSLKALTLHIFTDPQFLNARRKWCAWLGYNLTMSPEKVQAFVASDKWQGIDKLLGEGKLTPAEFFKGILTLDVEEDLTKEITKHDDVKIQKAKSNLRTNMIASCLLSAKGTLNTALIPYIKDVLTKLQFDSPAEKQHIESVLDDLYQDPMFADRLEKLQALKPGSVQEQLAKTQGYNPATGARSARRIALSALFTPTVQQQVGSCFGTAVVRQLVSFKEGRKQLLEDSISLLTNGCVTRTSPTNPPVSVSYPMSFDHNRYKKEFFGENYLMRAMEYTTSTTGGTDAMTRSEIDSAIWKPIENQIAAFAATVKPAEAAAMKGITDKQKEISAKILEEFNAKTALRYMGYMKSTAGKVGGWVVVNRETETPLISSRAEFEKVLVDILQTFLKQNPDLFSDAEKKVASNLIDHLIKCVKSDAYIAEILAVKPNEVATGFGFKPDAMKDCCLTKFMGGYSRTVIKNYHGSAVLERALPRSRNGLAVSSIIKFYNKLAPTERRQAESNPLYLRTFHTPTHAMNLKLGTMPRLMKVGAEGIRKEEEAFMAIPLTPLIEQQIIDTYIYNADVSIRDALKKALEKDLKEHAPKNIGELCKAIYHATATVKPHPDTKWRTANLLMGIFPLCHHVRDQLPPLYDIVDTNWDQGIAFGRAISPLGQQAAFTSKDGPPLRYGYQPWEPPSYQVLDFFNATDDIARKYAKIA